MPKVRAIATGEVSIWAIRTWWRIGGAVDEILPYVIDVLRRPRFEDEAPYLLSVLVEMGSAASSALPVLREVLDREPERGLREALRLTIEAIEE